MIPKRPKVVTYGLASVDGKITLSPDTLLLFGDPRWEALAGSTPGSSYQWLKATHLPTAMLEGSGSLILEDERPAPLRAYDGVISDLYQDYLPPEITTAAGRRGWFTIVDGRGRIRWMYKEWPGEDFAGWHLLVLVCNGTPADYLAYLQREHIPYLVAGLDKVDLTQALEKMHRHLGVDCVLAQGAGRLNGALIRSGLVDEVNVEFFPAIIGGSATPGLFGGPSLAADEWPVRLHLLSTHVEGNGHVWVRYLVEK